jgi:drug/metabolite transporter (DMT)-like permease
MIGEILASLAGIGFGIFQSINRRAAFGIDALRATFTVLTVSAIFLGIVSLITEDLNLLWQAPLSAWVLFILAGLVHFLLGWTLLNLSQRRIGASRTGALIGTTPLFATLLAAIMLGEWLQPLAIVGVVIVVMGVYFTTPKEDKSKTDTNASSSEGSTSTGFRSSLFGLATALCWAISPVFIRQALVGLPSPLLGVELGMIACSLSYGILLLLGRNRGTRSAPSREAIILLTIGGVISGSAIWARWAAIELTSVAVVTTLSLFSVIVVMILSPFVVGGKQEKPTTQAILGAAMILAGSVLLVLVQNDLI